MKKYITGLLVVVLLGGAAMLLNIRKQSVEDAATPTPLT